MKRQRLFLGGALVLQVIIYLSLLGCGRQPDRVESAKPQQPVAVDLQFHTAEDVENLRLIDRFRAEIGEGRYIEAQNTAEQISREFLLTQSGIVQVDFFGQCQVCDRGSCRQCQSHGRCGSCAGSTTCPSCRGNHTQTQPCTACICQTCNASGACRQCQGSGRTTCQRCNGSGRGDTTFTNCITCRGSGRYQFATGRVGICNQCNGQGRRVTGHQRCSGCNGNRGVPCQTCRGQARCGRCAGAGRTPNCRQCEGNHQITTHCSSCRSAPGTCQNCRGTGNCATCAGTGRCRDAEQIFTTIESAFLTESAINFRGGVFDSRGTRVADYRPGRIVFQSHTYSFEPSERAQKAVIGTSRTEFLRELQNTRRTSR